MKNLGDVAKLSAGGDKPKNFSKKITDKNIIPIYSNGIKEEGLYGYTDYAKIKEESVTVSARGTIGFVCLKGLIHTFLSSDLFLLIPIPELVTGKFLYLCLKNQNIEGNGTTQQQLTVPDLAYAI